MLRLLSVVVVLLNLLQSSEAFTVSGSLRRSSVRVGSAGSPALVARLDDDESEDDASKFVVRVRRGDTIDILACAVAAFFFAIAASGQLFVPFDSQSMRAAYTKVDADEILKEDFQRDMSSVMFDDS